MSTMAERKPKRQRRNFTDDFKAGAIRLVLEEGRSVATVARDLDLTESSLRNWVEQAKADAGRGRPGALTTAEREELTRLRRENRILQEEREILKKAAAFFAKERR
jgi:transposase